MTMILKNVFSLNELKIVVTLILFVMGMVFILKKHEPKLIREMKIAPEKKRALQKSVGLLFILAALLYPAEVCLSMAPVANKDFIELFWSGGLIVIALTLMFLTDYYRKK